MNQVNKGNAGRGAPKGNQNARKGFRWTTAINQAFERRSRVDQLAALDQLAEKLIDMAMDGDMQAIRELGDRLEGKPEQRIAMVGEDGGDLRTRIVVEYADPATVKAEAATDAQPV